MSDAFPNFETLQPPPYAQVTAMASSRENPYVRPINAAFEDAMAMRTRLREEVFQVEGLSGRKFRVFLNGLINQVVDPRYLEIGLLHGATMCPAIYKNKVKALGVDNWTQFHGTPEKFYKALNTFRANTADVTILEGDFRQVDYKSHGYFNILFYDASHTEQDQYDGITYPLSAMDRQYILIVDDWNWPHVRKSTYKALEDSRVKVDFHIEVRTTFNGEQLPLVYGRESEWHNGCVIAAVTKE
jgi:hypothetical protein